MNKTYLIKVLKKVGTLPNIEWKVVYEREFEVYHQEFGLHCDLELMFDTFFVLYPNRNDFKIVLEFVR